MKLASKIRQCVVIVALTFLLPACAETQLAAHYAKKIVNYGTGGALASKSQGTYKVGSPYKIKGRWYTPKEKFRHSEVGVASWYGPGFHGKTTANGETYDQYELTAAHRTLQMPSIVRVTNLENGRSVVVRINDRGPFAHGRVIDMSKRGAELLGFKKKGTAKVRVEILEQESRQVAALAKSGKNTSNIRLADLKRSPEPTQNRFQPVTLEKRQDVRFETARQEYKTANSRALPLPESLQPSYLITDAEALPATQNDAGIRRVSVQRTPQPAPLDTSTDFLNDLDFVRENRGTAPVARTPQQASHVTAGRALYVQAGAFTNYRNAERLAANLSGISVANISPTTTQSGTQLYRVRLGPLASHNQAQGVLSQVVGAGHQNALIIVD